MYSTVDDLNDQLVNIKSAITYMSEDERTDHCFRHEIISALKHVEWDLEQCIKELE